MSSFSLVLDELSSHEWDLGWLITGGGWNALCEMILIRPLTPPHCLAVLAMCRWSSAGRTAPSTSSEDGSPTARDSGRSPANTGSVSASSLWLRLACACLRMCDSCTCAPRRSRSPWKVDIYTTLVGYLWFHPINKIMIATMTWTTALQLKSRQWNSQSWW